MRERSAFERELEYLAEASTSLSARPAANHVDEEAAEPIFTGPVRQPAAPLPNAARLKKVIESNKKTHPKVSGITLAELRARLEQYIDRPALDGLMRQANAGAATPPYGSDEATVVTLLAHQFQQKTCRKTTIGSTLKQCTMDGTVAEDTLDALGLVYHLGGRRDLNSVDQANSTASATLRRMAASEFEGVEPGLTATTWWTYMVRPPWLGMPIRQGIHLVLLKRLRRAQRFLMGLHAYGNLSPAELGKVLGLEEELKGARPDAKTKSMHTFGLGIDIEFEHNPWLSNPERDTSRIVDITRRAAQFIGGRPRAQQGLTPALMHRIAVDNQDTGRIYNVLSEWSGWLGSYFALSNDPKRIESQLPVLNATNPDIGLINARESVPDAAKRWVKTIRADFENFAKAVARGGTRKEAVRNGFLSLPRDLVLALREYACLAWGAVDFGPGQNGDTMHFDCRVDGIGRAIRIATGIAAPTEGHRCIPAGGRTAAQREFEYEGPQPSQPSLRIKFPSSAIAYKGDDAKCRSSECSVYVPSKLRNQPKIDLLVFFHGLDTCKPRYNLDPALVVKNFRLDDQVDKAARRAAVAVPLVFYKDRYSANFRAAWSAAYLNSFVEEVLNYIGNHGTRPSLDHLILAGHSGAYEILTPLADQFECGVADTTRGAMAKLSKVLAMDTTYRSQDAKALEAWARKLVNAQFILVLSKSGDPPANWKNTMGRVTLPTNLKVLNMKEGHCELPGKYIQPLL